MGMTGVIGVLSWLMFLAVLVYAGFRSTFSIPEGANPFSRYLTISSYFSALFLWFFASYILRVWYQLH